jgi:hypothetical protein
VSGNPTRNGVPGNSETLYLAVRVSELSLLIHHVPNAELPAHCLFDGVALLHTPYATDQGNDDRARACVRPRKAERFSGAVQEAPYELDEEAIVGDARTGIRGPGIT